MDLSNQIWLGDCLELMDRIPDGAVDAVILDPPYHKVVSEDWDKQHKDLAGYVDFILSVVLECKRVLKSNGSLYIFGDDKNIAYVQVAIDQHLTLLNSLVWYKTGCGYHSLRGAKNYRSYAPMTERILFYTPQLCPTGLETIKLDINNFVSLRDYFIEAKNMAGISYKKINEVLGTASTGGGMASHYFSNIGQWELPTKDNYLKLQQLFNGFLRREYEDLRREYEDLRREYEDLRRVFNATSETLDVISGPIVSQKDNTDHPTTKPLWLIKKLILDSTNPGELVLDPTAGSATTAISCIETGRRWLCIEKDAGYYEIAKQRIEERLKQPFLPNIQPDPAPTGKQLELIG